MRGGQVRTRDRRARHGTTATVAVLGVVTALAACGSSAATPNTAERFSAAVESVDQGRELLTIADVIGSEWDHGVVVCPHDPVDAVESLLGARWPDAPSTADDGAAYVVVATGDAMVDTIRLDRAAVDPCPGTVLLSARTFGPTAVFHIGRARSGQGWTIGPNG